MVCYLSGMSDSLTDADIRKVAKLSRLSVTESQVPAIRTQLSSILGHIAKLQALPTGGVEPMAHPMTSDTAVQTVRVGARSAGFDTGRLLWRGAGIGAHQLRV